MTDRRFDALLQALDARKRKVYDFLAQPQYSDIFKPAHMRSAAYSYIKRGGKSLRPAVLMLSCGAVGGDEHVALPAAAAIEVYHTWTLVHDDMIDRDELRRGGPTIHSEYSSIAFNDMGYDKSEAAHYGLTIGILTGDLQQAWSIFLFLELARENRVDNELILALIGDLTRRVALTLIEGETLDVQYATRPIDSLNEDTVIDMLWKKTGVLYEFAGQAGAAIGRNDSTLQDEMVTALAAFCGRCGTAFQLQDDILGITGNESQLGKPVGSDIREGKRTTIILKAFKEANPAQRAELEKIVGKRYATDTEIEAASVLLRDLGGIAYTKELARRYVKEAIPYLDPVPRSTYRDILLQWAEYLVEREF